MLRLFVRFWAKLKYRLDLETEAARTDLNASLAAQVAGERRNTIAKLRKEADEIETRIKEYAAKEEAGFWLCENGHEFAEPAEIPVKPPYVGGMLTKCPTCKATAKFIKRSEMSGQERYESEKERKDAEAMVEAKRQAATQEEQNAEGGEQTAKTFRAQAQGNRTVADRISKL